jgi:carboxypeptidase C (cathepsin A)
VSDSPLPPPSPEETGLVADAAIPRTPAERISPADRSRLKEAIRKSTLALLFASALGTAAPLHAEEHAAKPAASAVAERLPDDAVTRHTLKLGGRELAYTATAGTLPLRDGKGEKQASVFYVAYTATGSGKEARPITFAFNGGPGAASAYLQLGALGPRILQFGPDGTVPPKSDHLVDNPQSWLAFTDLVFIDPVGTGYSRAVGGSEEAQKKFWGVRQDLDSLAAFIRLYLTQADRLQSPIYLAGESYGGFRAAKLPHLLAERQGIPVRGALLVSPALEFGLMGGNAFNPLPYALRLPAYAAVVLERRGELSPEALSEAEHFALGEYLLGLANPPGDPKKAAQFYGTVARLTGLPEPLVAQHKGRIPLGTFIKRFRHDQGLLVSRYDGSATGPDPYPAQPTARSGDPVLDGTRPIFTAAMVAYLRDELGFKTDLPYRLLDGEIAAKWDWRSGLSRREAYNGASDDMREALALHPRLRFLIVHGLTDLATPYMMSRYVIDHLPPLGSGPRVELKVYPGGHMMYLRPDSRGRLRDDAAAFYRETAG